MSVSKIRHDFASNEEIAGEGKTHASFASQTLDDNSSVYKLQGASLGDDNAGADELGQKAKIQFERDSGNIDSVTKLNSSQQQSMDIASHTTASAIRLFSNS